MSTSASEFLTNPRANAFFACTELSTDYETGLNRFGRQTVADTVGRVLRATLFPFNPFPESVDSL